MGLKLTVTKTEYDALPEATRALYEEKGGKYTLPVDDAVPASEAAELKTKLGEFRDNNREMFKELGRLRPLEDKYKDVDPDKYRELVEKDEALKKKGLKNADELSTLVANEVAKATKPLTEQLNTERTARESAQRETEQARFRELVAEEATRAGVLPNSLRFVVHEAGSSFELKNGTLAPKEGVKNPLEPHKDLTPSDWFQQLARTDANLFAPSLGGGANPENPGGGGGKPGARILINPSPEEKGRNMAAIAKGEVIVQYT